MKSVHTQVELPSKWMPIATAAQLISSDLDSHDLSEAFGMLSLRQQKKYLALRSESAMAYDADYEDCFPA